MRGKGVSTVQFPFEGNDGFGGTDEVELPAAPKVTFTSVKT